MIRVVTDRNKQTETWQKSVHQRSRIILTHYCDHQQQLGLLTRAAVPHSVIAFPSQLATAQWKLIGRSLLCMIKSDHFCLLATCISTACWSVCAISSALQQSSHYKSLTNCFYWITPARPTNQLHYNKTELNLRCIVRPSVKSSLLCGLALSIQPTPWNRVPLAEQTSTQLPDKLHPPPFIHGPWRLITFITKNSNCRRHLKESITLSEALIVFHNHYKRVTMS
jgi:hypothetical protein